MVIQQLYTQRTSRQARLAKESLFPSLVARTRRRILPVFV
jgi:hypothetical protein